MKNTVDYDEMFGTNRSKKGSTPRKEPKLDRFEQDRLEREAHQKKLEEFRSRSNRHEGYFDRADGFADMEFGNTPPMTHYQRERYYNLKTLDALVENIDGVAIGVLFAVLMWVTMESLIAVIIAFEVGFIGGVFLKLLVHDGMSLAAAKSRALPIIVESIIYILLIIFLVKYRG